MSLTTRPRIRSWLFLIAVAFTHTKAPAVGADESLPKDFRLVAHYYPAYSSWCPWETTITADGNATQEKQSGLDDEREWKKTFKVSPRDLRSLAGRVESGRFFDLKPLYEAGGDDSPTLVLKVTAAGREHEVAVRGPSHHRDDAEARRFFGVWAEVLKMVPSPNRGDSPKLYRPRKS